MSRFDGNHFPFCDAAIRVRHTNDLNADLSAPQCYCVRPFRVLQCLFYSSNQVFLFAPNFIPDLLQLGVRRVQTRTHFFLPTQIKPHPRKPETREHHRPVQLPKQSRARYYHPNESKKICRSELPRAVPQPLDFSVPTDCRFFPQNDRTFFPKSRVPFENVR